MSKNAFVLRARGINHGDVHHPHGSVIRDMPDGQFADWEGAEIVREATDDEVNTATKDGTDESAPAPPVRARTQLTDDEIAEAQAAAPEAEENSGDEEQPAPAKPAAKKAARKPA